MDHLSIMFDYEGEVSSQDSEEILTRISGLYRKWWKVRRRPRRPSGRRCLRGFAANLERAFYGFEPDFFQQNLIRIIDDVISQFKGSLEIWPTLGRDLLSAQEPGRPAHAGRPEPAAAIAAVTGPRSGPFRRQSVRPDADRRRVMDRPRSSALVPSSPAARCVIWAR